MLIGIKQTDIDKVKLPDYAHCVINIIPHALNRILLMNEDRSIKNFVKDRQTGIFRKSRSFCFSIRIIYKMNTL